MIDGCSAWQPLVRIFLPLALPGAGDGGAVRLHHLLERIPRRADLHESRRSSFTMPIMLVGVRTGDHGAVDWGALQAGVVISIMPCLAVYLAAAALLHFRPAVRARSNERGRRGDAPLDAGAPRAAHDPRRGAARRRLDRHGLQGAQRQRPPQRRNARESRCRSPRSSRYRPNDLAQSLHRARSMTVGMLSNDSFGRFSLSDRRGAGAAPVPITASRSSCATPPTIPSASAGMSTQLLGKRVDGLVVTARRADRRPPIEPLRARPAGDLCVFARRRSRRALSAARRRGRRAARGRTSVGSAGAASPISPGPSGSRRCACARKAIARRCAEAGLPTRPA